MRLAFLVLLVLFTLAATAGFFGERSRRASAAGDGYELTVEYPQSTRPGLASSLEFVVRRTDGGPLPDAVSLETSVDYLRLFDDHAIEPEPTVVRADGEDLVWTVSPEGDAEELRVYLDARIDPGVQAGRHDAATTLIVDGEAVLSVDYRTWMWP